MKDPATFVRITAALFLALSILCVLMDSGGLLFYSLFLQSVFEKMDYTNSMGPVNAWRVAHMNIHYGLHLLLSLAALVGSAGLLYKKTWAPRAFLYFLGAMLVFHFVNLGISLATVFTLPDTASMNGMPFPHGMMMLTTGFGALWIVALIILYSWLWFSFRKKEVQTVFD